MAFALHIRPFNALEAVTRYRDAFAPSRWRDEPRLMLSVHAVCADTDEAAAVLGRPGWVWKAIAQAEGVDSPLLDPVAAAEHVFSSEQQRILDAFRPHMAEGSAENVRAKLLEIVGTFQADELMLTTPVHDPGARLRSFELVARALSESPQTNP